MGYVRAFESMEVDVRGVHSACEAEVSAMKLLLATMFLLAFSGQAQHLTLKIVPVQLGPFGSSIPSSVTFSCTTSYAVNRCVADCNALAQVLTKYPIETMGKWQFVLASSDRWAEIMSSLGGHPSSPAFTVLDSRVTVLEEALFRAPPSRNTELLQQYGVSLDRLLDYAVTHELGHAMCHDWKEWTAEQVGRNLRAQLRIHCADNNRRGEANPHVAILH